MTPIELVMKLGGRFSKELGIDLSSGRSEEIFKWLIAAMLFGARISGDLAEKAYRSFERHGVLNPDAILETGWEGLVSILDEGSYVRYDFKTATKFLEAAENLKLRYAGNLNRLNSEAVDPKDLEARLKALAKGIGPVTAGVFLREMRGIWKKACPLPLDPVLHSARDLGYIPWNLHDREEALRLLSMKWPDGRDFPDFEAALVRWARRKKQNPCLTTHQPDLP